MKQHITVEQLEELDPEKYIKLVEKEYGTSMCNKYAKIENCKRLFNIGKMIEILDDEFMGIEENCIINGVGFYVNLRNYESPYAEELADALLQAVKKVL